VSAGANVGVADDRRVGAVAGGRAATSRSPNQRAWARFKRNRLGYAALWVFGVLLAFATLAELVSNERPLAARYQGELFFPIVSNQPETTFGGDFRTPTGRGRSATASWRQSSWCWRSASRRSGA